MANESEIANPVIKGTAALATAGGASAVSMTQKAQQFLPVDLAGWLAVAASAVALIYTSHLLCEWWWKKFWRGFFEARGWVKPLPARKVLMIDPEQLQVAE